MGHYVGFLVQQQGRNAEVAATPTVLERVGRVRDVAAAALVDDWSRAGFEAQRTRIEQ